MFVYGLEEFGFIALGIVGERAAAAANGNEGVGEKDGVSAEEGGWARWGGEVVAALKPTDSAGDDISVNNTRSEVHRLFGVEGAS